MTDEAPVLYCGASLPGKRAGYVNYIWPQVVSDDRKEAIDASRAKRRPDFKGR
jgi:hypothetical protein